MEDFKLSNSFLEQYQGKQPNWGPLGYITYKRTYARTLTGGGTEEFSDTCKRVVEGVYTVQKSHAKQLRLPWNNEKAQRSAQNMFKRMWEFKFLPPGRGLWMMGTDYIKSTGGAAANNPLHEDTRVYTRAGWVRLGDLEGCQSVELLSSSKKYARDNGESYASAPKWVTASVSNIEVQPSIEIKLEHYNGVQFSIVASENHRWYRRTTTNSPWERVSGLELNEGDYLPIVLPSKSYRASIFGAQHGLFFGDGTRSNGELHQFGSSVQVLKDLFGPLVEHVTHRRDDEYVVRNCPRSWGSVPLKSKDHSYIYGFLAGYFAADGSVTQSGQLRLASSRKEELESVAALFSHIGIRTTPISISSTSSNFSDSRELWCLSIYKYDVSEDFFLKEDHKNRWLSNQANRRTRDYAKVVSITSVGEQRVLCATVPEYEQFVTEGFVLTSNCGFVSTRTLRDDFAEPFCWLMDMLMLGVGVGFDTKGAGSFKVHTPRQGDDVFVVEDSREGWVALLRRVLTAYSGKGSLPKEIDYSKVRPFGEPIKGFGGTASGPEPLDDLIKSSQEILNTLVGNSITSEAIVDICNLVGRCVVAGNVRRSAEIAFGDPHDPSFLELKNPAVAGDKLYHHRWASNNSIFADVGMDYTKVAEMAAVNGEPGFEWLENAQMYSRMGRSPDYKDMRAMGGNPCLEQTLEDRELCCLVETFPSLHDSYEDFQETLKYAYLYAKSVTLIPTHDERTNAVMMRNRRIGCSMSGIVQAMKRHGRREFLNWCDQGYNYLDNLDGIYSEWLCVPKSIKKTSVKPSGTVSLLPGVTPGIHFPHSEYYIRRIRFQTDSPLVKVLMDNGYHCEPDSYSPNTTVVSFPIKEEYFDRSKDDVTMWEQLELAAKLQTYWADNQVSVTITFKKSEAKDIKYALELYEDRLKGVSFLPLNDHGYVQAPYETIDEATYKSMSSGVKPITSISESKNEVRELYCDGETCIIK